MSIAINMDELPKTFQQAIEFVRAAGYRYLWIDSLCIIQDSADDWGYEAALMGQVYKNAVCNIAATAASNGSVGCFFERSPALVQECLLTMTVLEYAEPNDLSAETTDFERSRRRWFSPDDDWISVPKLYSLVPEYMVNHTIQDTPLGGRAWVMQERYLSPRILHCGRHQIFWECSEMVNRSSFLNHSSHLTVDDSIFAG